MWPVSTITWLLSLLSILSAEVQGGLQDYLHWSKFTAMLKTRFTTYLVLFGRHAQLQIGPFTAASPNQTKYYLSFSQKPKLLHKRSRVETRLVTTRQHKNYHCNLWTGCWCWTLKLPPHWGPQPPVFVCPVHRNNLCPLSRQCSSYTIKPWTVPLQGLWWHLSGTPTARLAF